MNSAGFDLLPLTRCRVLFTRNRVATLPFFGSVRPARSHVTQGVVGALPNPLHGPKSFLSSASAFLVSLARSFVGHATRAREAGNTRKSRRCSGCQHGCVCLAEGC